MLLLNHTRSDLEKVRRARVVAELFEAVAFFRSALVSHFVDDDAFEALMEQCAVAALIMVLHG